MNDLSRVGGSYRHSSDPGEPSTGAPRLSVTDAEGTILSALFHRMIVAEVGTGLGISTKAIARTAQRVHTVDIDPWVQSTIWPTLPNNVTCHKSVDNLPKFVDAVFIDGDHSTDATRRDLDDARQRASLLIVMHDVNYHNVRVAVDDPDEWLFIPTEHGIGVRWLN